MTTFEAECDSCGVVATFEEGSREKRNADFTLDIQYFFRCGNCGYRTDKMMDTAGVLHKMTGNKHTQYEPGT